MTALTVVILTLNEAERVGRALTSVPKGTRVVVIDSDSKDGTLEAARKAWLAKGRSENELALVSRPWPGFTRARNESLAWVNTEWVLWLDADEWIEADLARFLENDLARVDAGISILDIARQSHFLGRPIRHGGWYPDRKRRLARAARAEWRSGPRGADVHEDLHPQGDDRVATASGHLGHEPFRDQAEQEATNDHYSTLLAEGLAKQWQERNRSAPSDAYIATKVGVKFIENYIWKAGFLDGAPGLRIALGSSKSLRMRLTKARELLRRT